MEFLKWIILVISFASTVESAPHQPSDPCWPSPPCGPNSQCTVEGEKPSCSCIPGFIGSPPNCRPQCNINSECPDDLACINQRCKNPCPEACALNADCRVIIHKAICSCISGYTGDPLVQCDAIKDAAPTTEQTPKNPNITNEFNYGVATILYKFRPGGNIQISSKTDPILKYKMQSDNGILYNVFTTFIPWSAAHIGIPSNVNDNFSYSGVLQSAELEAKLSSSSQAIKTEKLAINYIVKLTPQNEISDDYPNFNFNEIKLLANDTQYKPNDETAIKKEIETHIKKTFHDFSTESKRDIIFVREMFTDLVDQFSHSNQERYYFIGTISSTNYTLNNVTIYGLWNVKGVSFNGSDLANLPELDMGSVRGSLVLNSSSGSEELSFKADNIYISADQNIAKVKVKANAYSVINVKLNTTLAEDQSKSIIGEIESAIAASLQSVWDQWKLRT